MKTRRTPWWHPLTALIVGVAAGAGVALLDERCDLGVIGAPWFVAALLVAIGVGVGVLAWNVRKYAATDPRKRPSTFINPLFAFRTLALCKALILAGAALAGWYGGQIIPSIAHLEASYYANAVAECAVTAVVCLADMVVGIIGERWCELPPLDGPESAKAKQRATGRNVAPAAAKTRHE